MDFSDCNQEISDFFDFDDASSARQACPIEQHGESDPVQDLEDRQRKLSVKRGLWPNKSSPLVVLYNYHPFISSGQLSSLSPASYQALEDEGCFHVPQKHLLDEFVRQYFLYTHPFLPMLDQSSFWKSYRGEQCINVYSVGIPLLFIRAMLFATCHLTAPYVITSLGFDTLRECRAELYYRAKLLYDSDTESSNYWKSQSALLLSFWVPRDAYGEERSNTNWLGAAIRHAKLIGAHNFASLIDEESKRILYKKLWWSCIIRDRILPMGLRRDIQIRHPELNSNPVEGIMLTELEIEDGKNESTVVDNITKVLLTKITLRFAQLCLILTDLLDRTDITQKHVLGVPGDDGLSAVTTSRGQEMKQKLVAWHRETSSQLPLSTIGNTVAHLSEPGRSSVLFHAYVMYMYYFSSVIYLGDREVWHLLSTTPDEITYTFLRFSHMHTFMDDIWEGIRKFTKCMSEIMQLGLARYLPISLVAFTAKPLALLILFAQAQNNFKYPCKAYGKEAAEKQEQLNILIKAMKMFRDKFDGVESVSAIIREANDHAQLYELDQPYNATRFWAETLSRSPDVYARLTATMDLSLGMGRVTRSDELPVKL
ncbi:putative Fungal specific transcription factor domain-containing protein [Seiridium cardinale]|uniref:Fungal specific transcription factor domain-containing protein n=1 Tax=Seiridium cardinale TaxID=138064 RepID=A0ABR2XC94_9PEZI